MARLINYDSAMQSTQLSVIITISLVALALPGVAGATSDAGACIAPIAYPAPGSIPQNLPGFVVVHNGNDPSGFLLFRIESNGAETMLPARIEPSTTVPEAIEIIPTDPLVVGARYAIHTGACLFDRTQTWPAFVYDVISAWPEPTSFGILSLSPLHRFARGEGAFYSFDATLEPSSDFVPWLSLYELRYSADTVNGSVDLGRHSGGERSALSLRVEVACDSTARPFPYSVPPGAVTVHFVASRYFGGGMLSADASATYVCANAIDVSTELVDGGAGLADARGGPADAGLLARSGNSGSGCAVARGGARAHGGFAVALLAPIACVACRRFARRRTRRRA